MTMANAALVGIDLRKGAISIATLLGVTIGLALVYHTGFGTTEHCVGYMTVVGDAGKSCLFVRPKTRDQTSLHISERV